MFWIWLCKCMILMCFWWVSVSVWHVGSSLTALFGRKSPLFAPFVFLLRPYIIIIVKALSPPSPPTNRPTDPRSLKHRWPHRDTTTMQSTPWPCIWNACLIIPMVVVLGWRAGLEHGHRWFCFSVLRYLNQEKTTDAVWNTESSEESGNGSGFICYRFLCGFVLDFRGLLFGFFWGRVWF